MKVLHILNELKYSGAEVMLKVALEEFNKSNIESHIVSKGKYIGNYAKILKEEGYKTSHISFKPAYKVVFNMFRMVRYINRNEIDVIHIHTGSNYLWVLIASKLSNAKKIIRTVHNAFYLNGIRYFKHYIERKIARIFDVKHYSISESVHTSEKNEFNNETVIIDNWYNDKKFEPVDYNEKSRLRKSLKLPVNKTILITVGNGSKVKNYWSIIDSLQKLDKNIIYIYIGNQDPNVPESDYARRSGVGDRFFYLGSVNNVDEYLKASDIYLMPSLYEGFGIAAIEAIGVGLPCILSEAPGLKDFIEAGKGVYYINLDNIVAGICEKIEFINDLSVGEKEEIKNNLSNFAKTNFGIENGVRRYIQVYNSIQ